MGPLRGLMQPRMQPLRYAVIGVLTALTYFLLTLLFTGPVNAPIQLAMVIAYPLSLCVHFVGQRLFVFASAEGFALAMHRQAGRYVVIGGVQLVFSLLITTFVPDLLGIDERIVYVVATFALAGASYLMLRFHVFHAPRRILTAHRSG